MTRDEIIEMARETGFYTIRKDSTLLLILEAFAKLVAAKAIKELESQEPVAWWNDTGTHIDLNVSGRGTPLYTYPPQRTWVGLTPADRGECLKAGHDQGWTGVMEATQAKLKEKNK